MHRNMKKLLCHFNVYLEISEEIHISMNIIINKV